MNDITPDSEPRPRNFMQEENVHTPQVDYKEFIAKTEDFIANIITLSTDGKINPERAAATIEEASNSIQRYRQAIEEGPQYVQPITFSTAQSYEASPSTPKISTRFKQSPSGMHNSGGSVAGQTNVIIPQRPQSEERFITRLRSDWKYKGLEGTIPLRNANPSVLFHVLKSWEMHEQEREDQTYITQLGIEEFKEVFDKTILESIRQEAGNEVKRFRTVNGLVDKMCEMYQRDSLAITSDSKADDKASAWEKLLLIHQQPIIRDKRADSSCNDEIYRTLLGADSVAKVLTQYKENWAEYLDCLENWFPELHGCDHRMRITVKQGHTNSGDKSLANFEEFRISPNPQDGQKSNSRADRQKVCALARQWPRQEVLINRTQLGITSHCFLLVSSIYDELMINEGGFKDSGATRSLRGHLYGELRCLITEAWEAEQHSWDIRALLLQLLSLAEKNKEWASNHFKYLQAKQRYDWNATSARAVHRLNNLVSTQKEDTNESVDQIDLTLPLDDSMMAGLDDEPNMEQVNALDSSKPRLQKFCFERYGESGKCSLQECTFIHDPKQARTHTDYRLRRAITLYANHHNADEAKMLREEWSSGAIKA